MRIYPLANYSVGVACPVPTAAGSRNNGLEMFTYLSSLYGADKFTESSTENNAICKTNIFSTSTSEVPTINLVRNVFNKSLSMSNTNVRQTITLSEVMPVTNSYGQYAPIKLLKASTSVKEIDYFFNNVMLYIADRGNDCFLKMIKYLMDALKRVLQWLRSTHIFEMNSDEIIQTTYRIKINNAVRKALTKLYDKCIKPEQEMVDAFNCIINANNDLLELDGASIKHNSATSGQATINDELNKLIKTNKQDIHPKHIFGGVFASCVLAAFFAVLLSDNFSNRIDDYSNPNLALVAIVLHVATFILFIFVFFPNRRSSIIDKIRGCSKNTSHNLCKPEYQQFYLDKPALFIRKYILLIDNNLVSDNTSGNLAREVAGSARGLRAKKWRLILALLFLAVTIIAYFFVFLMS